MFAHCQVSKCFISAKICIVNVSHVSCTFHLVILILCWKVHAIISCDHIFNPLAIPSTFRLCKSWFNFWAIFLKFLLFWHHVIFIQSKKCFSILFVAIFCNYSPGLSMHHGDSKLYYQKTAYKRNFMFFVLSVGDFGTLVTILCKGFIWHHESYRNFWCWCKSYIYVTFWCINFLLFWHEDVFMLLMILFVLYI